MKRDELGESSGVLENKVSLSRTHRRGSCPLPLNVEGGVGTGWVLAPLTSHLCGRNSSRFPTPASQKTRDSELVHVYLSDE